MVDTIQNSIYLEIVFYAAIAGITIPLGGLLAKVERFQKGWLEQDFRHSVIAFGGGILLSAVALVLVPEGTELAGSNVGVVSFVAGGISFYFIERWMAKLKISRPQFLAMLLDYIPETLALGGMLAVGSNSVGLLTFFIALQNLPEGFNAYKELVRGASTSKFKGARYESPLYLMFALTLLGPIVGLLGYFFLSSHPSILGGIMLFASGGILYIVFQDIAPSSVIEKHWEPPLGAVLGFSIGLIGKMLVN